VFTRFVFPKERTNTAVLLLPEGHNAAILLLPIGVGAGLPAIWREAAANPVHPMCQAHRAIRVYYCFAADRRQASSYGLRPESKVINLLQPYKPFNAHQGLRP
jgi:hypothetical protein